MIKVEVNNEGSLELEQNKEKLIVLKTINSNGGIERADGITQGDFVMLLNYYRYVKDNNIKCDFINPYGINEL